VFFNSVHVTLGKDRGNGRNKRVYNKKAPEMAPFCVWGHSIEFGVTGATMSTMVKGLESELDRKPSVPSAGSKNIEGPVQSVTQGEEARLREVQTRSEALSQKLFQQMNAIQEPTKGASSERAFKGIIDRDLKEVKGIGRNAELSRIDEWEKSLGAYAKKYDGSPESEAALQEQIGRRAATIEQRQGIVEQHNKSIDEMIGKVDAMTKGLTENNVYGTDGLYKARQALEKAKLWT